MKTTVEEKDGVITVVFEGRMDTKSTPEVEEDLKPLFDSESQEIVIDCSNLEYVASSSAFSSALRSTPSRKASMSLSRE